MNSTKGQKDMTLKYGLPKLLDAQYAIGEECRNKSKKNKETEPKENMNSGGCDWWWKQSPMLQKAILQRNLEC